MVAKVPNSFLCLLSLPRQLLTSLDQEEPGLCCFPPEWRCSEGGVTWLVQGSWQVLWVSGNRQEAGKEAISLLDGRDGSQSMTNMLSVSAQSYWNLLPGRSSLSDFVLWGRNSGLDGYTRGTAAERCSASVYAHNGGSPLYSRLLSPWAYLTPEAQCGGISAYLQIKVELAGFTPNLYASCCPCFLYYSFWSVSV